MKNDALKKKSYQDLVKIAPEDTFISLQHIDKVYPNKVQAVFDFNLDIKQHDFIVLVGPSGCGKSTTLRMIAGLEDISAGNLFIDGKYANDLLPKDRDIAMVFQSYALYPHMSVEQNMAFGIKIRKAPTPVLDEEGKQVTALDEKKIASLEKDIETLKKHLESEECIEEEKEGINNLIAKLSGQLKYYQENPQPVYKYKKLSKEDVHERVLKAANILQIEEYLDRKPRALSGGQCQRVALGRAIVRNSKVFLMDEPLSNLDAKLRVQMRSEIIKLHNSLNATTIYVTHDQTEAMTMATKIVVMDKGYIQQIGSPDEIFYHPNNLFVATFIGSPSMNLFEGVAKNNKLILDGDEIELTKEMFDNIERFYIKELESYKNEREDLINNALEYKSIKEQIESSEDENKKQELIDHLKKVESFDERLTFLNDAIAKYEDFISKKEYGIVFGIRPENIYTLDTLPSGSKNLIKKEFEVVVSELTGLEFFVHVTYLNKDLIARIKSRELIKAGDKLELVFGLDDSHIFDIVSKKAIF